MAHGYMWGPEDTACDFMKPLLSPFAKDFANLRYYRIVVNKYRFLPGEKLYIRIQGKTGDDRYTYQGAMLTVKNGGKSVGEWGEFHVNKYSRISCGGVKNTAVVEANDWEKRVEDDVFVWTAPSECDFSASFYIPTVRVIKNDNEYSPKMVTRLECIQDTNDPHAMPEMYSGDACTNNPTKIPTSNTGFETDFGGWWNEPTAALRWTRQSGPSPSPQTGPMQAIEGKWYIHAEGSYPARPGEQAILNNPPGLEGCACVRIECHMFGGPGLRFDFKINGDISFSHVVSLDEWIRAYSTVNVPGGALVQLVMTRGDDFRGDLAIDDITIEPGMCAEDVRLNKVL
ncbi:uncharacterized protein LOC144419940 isoform X2 [Styela clava]